MPFLYVTRYIICGAIVSGILGYFLNYPLVMFFIGLTNGFLSFFIAKYFWDKKQYKLYGNKDGIVETSPDAMHFTPSIDFKNDGMFKKTGW